MYNGEDRYVIIGMASNQLILIESGSGQKRV